MNQEIKSLISLPSVQSIKKIKTVSLHHSIFEKNPKKKGQIISVHEKATNNDLNITKSSNNSSKTDIKKEAFSKTLSSKFKTQKSPVLYDKRIRNYEVKLSNKLHIFYGLLYVQYEGYNRYGKILSETGNYYFYRYFVKKSCLEGHFAHAFG